MPENREITYIFYCKHCGLPMWLPAEKLRYIFEPPHIQQALADCAVIACPACKHMCSYSLRESSAAYNAKDLVAWSCRRQDAVLLGHLRCESEGCMSQVLLFAVWNPTTTEEWRKADILTWQWEGLRCPQGHEIKALKL